MLRPLYGSLSVLAPLPPPVVGGGSGAFSPLSLPNLTLWLDATQISASDGDFITSWSDQSGQGNDATGGYYVEYTLVGDKPVVRFAGYNGFTFANALTPYPLYIAMAVRTTTSDSDVVMLSTYEGDDGGFAVGVRNGTFKFFTQNDDPPFQGNAFQPDTFVIVEAVHDGDNKYLYADGTNLLYYGAESCPLTYGDDPSYVTSLGYLAAQGGRYQYFTGDIAEVIVCSAAPDADTQSAVRAYLASKWQQ